MISNVETAAMTIIMMFPFLFGVLFLLVTAAFTIVLSNVLTVGSCFVVSVFTDVLLVVADGGVGVVVVSAVNLVGVFGNNIRVLNRVIGSRP